MSLSTGKSLGWSERHYNLQGQSDVQSLKLYINFYFRKQKLFQLSKKALIDGRAQFVISTLSLFQ